MSKRPHGTSEEVDAKNIIKTEQQQQSTGTSSLTGSLSANQELIVKPTPLVQEDLRGGYNSYVGGGHHQFNDNVGFLPSHVSSGTFPRSVVETFPSRKQSVSSSGLMSAAINNLPRFRMPFPAAPRVDGIDLKPRDVRYTASPLMDSKIHLPSNHQPVLESHQLAVPSYANVPKRSVGEDFGHTQFRQKTEGDAYPSYYNQGSTLNDENRKWNSNVNIQTPYPTPSVILGGMNPMNGFGSIAWNDCDRNRMPREDFCVWWFCIVKRK